MEEILNVVQITDVCAEEQIVNMPFLRHLSVAHSGATCGRRRGRTTVVRAVSHEERTVDMPVFPDLGRCCKGASLSAILNNNVHTNITDSRANCGSHAVHTTRADRGHAVCPAAGDGC